MVAFFCATPYQVLVSIHIKTTFFKNVNADIYILNHFANSSKLVKNLSSQNIFRTVKEVPDSLNFTKSLSQKSRKRHFIKFFSYYNYKKSASRFFDIDTQIYDDVFFSYADVIIQLGLKKILFNNRNCKIHLFEDGVGGYLKFGTTTTQKKKLFNRLTNSNGLENYVDLYAFAPELMYQTTIPIVKMPKINKTNYIFSKQLNAVFNFNDSKVTDKFIILEQPLDFKPYINEIQFSTFMEIKSYSHIIKIHPRSKSEQYEEFNNFCNSDVPWEIISLNSNFQNQVLVTYYSTGAITNKLIFDVEMPIIFLYEMEEFKTHFSLSEDINLFFKKFQKSCRNPAKIFFPKNISELKDIIEVLNA
ncbi:hypothetical protein [Epilithonimonas xixisoli]|uniref:Glycosyltransferase family 52 n=1 Tax=Epilithonimonas xixisoli TaxID=1476462 RepID=A0A4R8I5B7_9FLAO|nr:hypothetical protein [Epilithonimonas xixisoli]TDX84093.1 hypothetical protein B0I22_1689 [Epilithonimonas xixisoli]